MAPLRKWALAITLFTRPSPNSGMLELRGLSKSYGAVRALRSVSLSVAKGEVLAVCGENGAGKSTLNRILAGAVAPDEGSVVLDSAPLPFGDVRAAERAGVVMVHQEAATFLDLTAAENHGLMDEPTTGNGVWLDRKEMTKRATASLDTLGEDFDVANRLADLSPAQRQMVALARATSQSCQVLILDEPTASLSARECESLFRAVKNLAAQGVTVLYVTHRLDEVFVLADRIAVLRDGELVSVVETAATSRDELVRLMVGRELQVPESRGTQTGEVALNVEGLTREGEFQDVSFSVRRGEIVALAGLVGAGRSELVQCIFGLVKPSAGRVSIVGKLALVPEDRQHQGLHLPFSVRENIAMASLRPSRIAAREEQETAEAIMTHLKIKAPGKESNVASLSGGNQQKTLLGKWAASSPDILILDEPTRGVDVGSKAQIHQMVKDWASEGKAVVVVSSEMEEVLALGDRIVVLSEGRVTGELSREGASSEAVLQLALPSGGHESRVRGGRRGVPREAVVALLLALLFVGVSAVNPAFASAQNINDMLIKIAPVAAVGAMMTLLIASREIDISIGSMMGFVAALLGVMTSASRFGLPVALGILICLVAGVLGGVLNGFLTAVCRIPSIIVTLGMLSVWRGATELLLGGKWIVGLPPQLREIGTGSCAGLANPIWLAIAVVLSALWIARRTPFGLRVAALGSNPEAARLRGVNGVRLKLAVFALVGLSVGIAAIFSSTQLDVIESGFGLGFELAVIAAVVVGGTSILGGRTSVLGTVLGASLLGVVSTALIFLKLGEAATYWERAIQGGLILIAVAGDQFRRLRGVARA